MKLAVALNLAVFLLATCLSAPLYAQEGRDPLPTRLPQNHEYQKVLRNYMATLKEADFTHGIHELIPLDKNTSTDPEYLYRNYILALTHQPLVGTKRGWPSVNAPPALFVLSAIETPNGVMRPCVWPEAVVTLAQWDYPGNLYRNNRGLKMRAFVGGAVAMMMFHDFAEENDGKVPPPIRADWHGYFPVYFAAAYPGFKDLLPPEVQKAYETGMKMVGQRMLAWGIRGESCDSDLMAPLGLIYISRAINDAEFAKAVEERTRMVCTDPRYFSSSGYWVERGGIDIGFGGIANLYAAWIALMTDWPFARDAVERTYRLRGHLILPEPDGKATGPTHFNARLGSPPDSDQFAIDGVRDVAAAMVTDEAAQFIGKPAGRDGTAPTPEVLKGAPSRRAHDYNEDIAENPRIREADKLRHIRNDEIKLNPWRLYMWWTNDFPISVNPAYEFYRKGTFAHRQELEQKNSPMLKSPFLRGENFVRDFDKAFVVARQGGYAAIIHTGPVGVQTPDDNKAQFQAPLGLGGGQLSAFWTPKTGSTILGLRSGASYDRGFDKLEDWRLWPIHAVSGVTAGGKVVTSGRIVKPDVETKVLGNTATIKVSGLLQGMRTVPIEAQGKRKAGDLVYDEPTGGKVEYSRTFLLDEKGVRVETTIAGDGKETFAELVETIPAYLNNPEVQANVPQAIEFQIDGAWTPATDKYAAKVQAVKLTRFDGAAVVKFESPCRVKLSSANWTDSWFTKATARNVVIDLLERDDKPAAVNKAKKIAYRIEPAAK
ncbi:MAG: hypothetical protein NTW19_04570 [Planctomycetota bacterium]|nr:hypothetical protein [Planctomycetota bacterium]